VESWLHHCRALQRKSSLQSFAKYRLHQFLRLDAWTSTQEGLIFDRQAGISLVHERQRALSQELTPHQTRPFCVSSRYRPTLKAPHL